MLFRKFLCAATVLVAGAFGAAAQDFNHYKPVKAEGQIPKRFVTSSTEKYMKDRAENIKAGDNSKARREKEKFYLETNFAIDQLLLSGKVLFNDPISTYCGKVLDEVLKDDKDLRGKLEVYVVRSTEVNAFTTNNGVILVTMGLVAQLENEAQLALILCHEVIHYKNHHALDRYVEKQKMRANQGVYRRMNIEDRLLARSNFSKSQESEADLEGLAIYLKSKYSTKVVDGVFDVLQYSHLPFDEQPFKKEFLETSTLKLPQTLFLEKVKEIKSNDEESDSFATHPSAARRRTAMAERLTGESDNNKVKYVISEKEFARIQKMCRYELTGLHLKHREYERAFYNSYLLLQDEPKSFYLRMSVVKAMYGLTKYRNASSFDDVHEDYDDKEGESQQVFYLFQKMKKKELGIVALNYAWRLHSEFPKDEELTAVTEDLFKEVVKENKLDRDYFLKTPPADTTAAALAAKAKEDEVGNKTDEEKEGEKGGKSKYDKIRAEKNKNKDKGSKEKDKNFGYLRYAFVEEQKDPAFTKAFNVAQEYKEQQEKNEDDYNSTVEQAAREKQEKRNERNGFSLGVDKVVVVNPFYMKDFESKDVLLETEKAQKDLHGYIQKACTDLNLSNEILDKKDLKESDVDRFNDIVALNDYLMEFYSHEDVSLVNLKTEDLKRISDHYGARYLVFTGVYYDTKNANTLYQSWMCCLPNTLPFAMIELFRSHNNTIFYTLVIDLEKNEKVMHSARMVAMRDQPYVVKSMVYDTFNQIKRKKK